MLSKKPIRKREPEGSKLVRVSRMTKDALDRAKMGREPYDSVIARAVYALRKANRKGPSIEGRKV